MSGRPVEAVAAGYWALLLIRRRNTQQQDHFSELSEYLLTQKKNQKKDLNLFYHVKKKRFGKQTPVPNLF